MKSKILIALMVLAFNTAVASAISVATGFNPVAVLGVGSALSMLPLTPAGALGMAVQKEIWMNSIVEGLFADNTFLAKAFNADEFVNNGKTVHIPNAGVASNVVKNRTSYPATVSARTDTDLEFNLDEYTTDPVRIPNAETVELSYNKRESVIKGDRAKIIEEVSNDVIFKWSPASTSTIRTTGAAVLSHTTAATGNRKAFDKANVKAAMVKFNKSNVPKVGRYMLVDSDMYGQLLDSLTEKEETAFHSQADVAKGVMGKLYSFEIMERATAALYTSALAPKLLSAEGAATDCAAALAWQENSVCRAKGEIIMFESPSDPLYYGDIYSFLLRCGGRPMREGVEGLLAIVQDASA